MAEQQRTTEEIIINDQQRQGGRGHRHGIVFVLFEDSEPSSLGKEFDTRLRDTHREREMRAKSSTRDWTKEWREAKSVARKLGREHGLQRVVRGAEQGRAMRNISPWEEVRI
jgi:hypothetical protein